MNPEAVGLLVECRDEPGLLHRITEAILRHGANISYVAGGASRSEAVAELQLEVAGAPDQERLVSDLESVQGVTKVSLVPTFQMIYGKRVIVIGGGAQVGMVAQGAISEADRHNIRGERISVDTIPLVGEEQLADAVRAVARLHRARALVLAGDPSRRNSCAVHEHGGVGAGRGRRRGERSGRGRSDGGHADRRHRQVLDRPCAGQAVLAHFVSLDAD